MGVNRVSRIVIIATVACLLAGCESTDAAERATPRPPPLADATVQAAPTEPIIGLVAPRYTVELRAETPGRIVELPVRLGDQVPSGSRLARLQNPDTEHELLVALARRNLAQAQLAEAKTERTFKASEAGRTDALAQFVSADDRRRSRHAARGAQGSADAARARVAVERANVERLETRLRGLDLNAPFDGKVSAVLQSRGQRILENEPVVRLNSAAVVIRFAVPVDIGWPVEVGDAVLFLPMSEQRTVCAQVISTSPEVDMAGMVLAEAEVETRDAPSLRPGTRGQVSRSPL